MRAELIRFRDRLDEALAQARRAGRLSEREYDALLLDPDFDSAEFERFRSAAERAGIVLPEEEAESTAAPESRALLGEPERDLLDVYLNEIGKVPLLTHPDLLALSHRARSGDEDARKRIILANLRLVVH